MISRFSKLTMFAAVFAASLAFIAPDLADAKLSKSGGGVGSRGANTNAAPPVTNTAPRTAAPVQNSGAPRVAAPAAGAAAAANATKPGLFGSMSKGGFMAGLLGAGALGMLLGYGMSGGLGGIGAMLGLILQIALFAGVAMLLFSWWQRRKQQNDPAFARQSAGGGYGQQPGAPYNGGGQADMQRSGSSLGAMGIGAGAGAAAGGIFGGQAQQSAPAPVPTRPLTLAGEEFGAFETLLANVHEAFAKEDQTALRQLCTEEMADYFTQDIAENVRNNRAARISDVRLEQGDLAEAWKEPDAEYATVAMRFSMIDQLVDRRSGQLVEGSATQRRQVTEIWTFVRQPAGKPQDWKLSAIQDAEQ